jgi:hypothetical protein
LIEVKERRCGLRNGGLATFRPETCNGFAKSVQTYSPPHAFAPGEYVTLSDQDQSHTFRVVSVEPAV